MHQKLHQTRQMLRVLLARPGVPFAKKEYLFILSHMRSRSSLLSHILGSHADISGHGEMHQSYRGPLNFMKLNARVSLSIDGPLAGRYVLDKILHDIHPVSDAVLAQGNLKLVFLIRKPEDMIPSLWNLGRKYGRADWYRDPEKAGRYYADRVNSLRAMAERTAAPCFFIESDELIERTRPLLDRLSGWLELDPALEERYSTFGTTGQSGRGDPSSAIREGKIVATQRSDDGPPIPEPVRAETGAAYERCRDFLRERCERLPD